MKREIIRYIRFLIGLVCCALGVVTILNSELGLSPWDVLNQGLNRICGISIGQANLLVGAIVVGFTIALRQPIGSGTLINMLIVGVFIDIFIYLGVIPKSDNFVGKVIILLIGIVIFSYGGYLYISSGIGCGPRDGLMVILTKKTGIEFWKIKTVVELTVLGVGYFLGGIVGIGTVITSLLVGPITQLFFKISKKDIKVIEHRNVIEEFRLIRGCFKKND